MAVDARCPEISKRGEKSNPFSLWFGGNFKITDRTDNNVNFQTPSSNFYSGKTKIKITGIGKVVSGKLTAFVSSSSRILPLMFFFIVLVMM